MMRLKLVTFDVTGTLLNFRVPVMHQYVNIASRYGVRTVPEMLYPKYKKSWKHLTEKHPNFGKDTNFGWQEWWTQLVMETFEGSSDAQTLRQIAEHLIEHFTTDRAWCVATDAEATLKELREKYNLGVISNFDPRLHIILEKLNLTTYFSFILTSYEVGYMKPDKRIFQEAIKRANLSLGIEAVHVGNDINLDYNAARSAGWQAICIDMNGNNFSSCVRSLKEIPTFLDKNVFTCGKEDRDKCN